MRRLSARVAIPAALLVGLLTGCADEPPEVRALPADVGAPTSDPVVRVIDNAFDADEVVVQAGTTVTWVWEGRALHDVVGPGFATDPQAAGTFAHTFVTPGAYDYVCTLHAGMTGVVNVVDR